MESIMFYVIEFYRAALSGFVWLLTRRNFVEVTKLVVIIFFLVFMLVALYNHHRAFSDVVTPWEKEERRKEKERQKALKKARKRERWNCV